MLIFYNTAYESELLGNYRVRQAGPSRRRIFILFFVFSRGERVKIWKNIYNTSVKNMK